MDGGADRAEERETFLEPGTRYLRHGKGMEVVRRIVGVDLDKIEGGLTYEVVAAASTLLDR